MSIASLGSGSLFASDMLDAQLVQKAIQDRDTKIQELKADKVKLKQLLKKAKVALDSLTSKHKAVSEQARLIEVKLQHSEEKSKTLEHKLSEFQRRKNGVAKNEVSQILARIKVGETGYTLIQDVEHGACDWYRDNLIVNIQEQLTSEWKQAKQVNYSTVFTEL